MKSPRHALTLLVHRRQRGSALITVLLFAFILLLLAGSVTQWSVTERRMNARNGYWLEARNAAEAVTEYACYQVAQAFNTRMNPTFTSAGTDPLTLPTSVMNSYFSGSHIDMASLTVKAGDVMKVPANGTLHYIDPKDPNNVLDPLIGRYVYRRDVKIIGKATINATTGGGAPVTAYVEEKMSIRGAPLFAYAIFYSGNDLEFGETPQMDIYGPVHVNGNLFVGPAGPSGSTPSPLGFHGPVTASGHVFHAWRGTTSTAKEGGSILSQTTAVNFSTDGVGATSGTMVNMRDSNSVWQDSTRGQDASTSGLDSLLAFVNPDQSGLTQAQKTAIINNNATFAQYASQTWKGNLQTAAMGIQPYNPMGFSEVVADDGSPNKVLATEPEADDAAVVGTGTGYGKGYGPHSLIEPPLAAPSSGDPYGVAKQAIEEGKFSRKAALYLKVDSSGNMTLMADPNSASAGTPSADKDSLTGRLILASSATNPAIFPSNVFKYIAYSTTTNSGNTVVSTGMYDQRQDKPVNLVQIDVAALKTALTHITSGGSNVNGTDFIKRTDSQKWGSGTANIGYDQYTTSSTGWNGGVYVEIDQSTATGPKQTAVILTNGQVAAGSSLVPTGSAAPNAINGLTVATNGPVYILGNFNSNGDLSGSNPALYPDDSPGTAPASSVEAPVAIAADAVTVLSPNYFGATDNVIPSSNSTSSGSNNAWKSYYTNAPPTTGDVEIAAALITGTVTTTKDSNGTQMYSGGVHNLPRFLENWGSGSGQKTVAIRGSMVSMYNCRYATAGWSQSYYSAPKRQWGFDQIFANGKYPPICPQVISYRRVDFTYLTPAQYTSELNTL